ncbi:MAG: type II secretion system protein GspG [Phycisphaerales bacterium JB058]
MNTRTNTRLHARGFSLLELTLVIAIMGVLMAVAAINLIGGADDAKIETTKASMKTIKDALQQYQTRNNSYPPALQTLITGTKQLQEGADLDSWDQPFYYSPVGRSGAPKEQGFTLISGGPDTQMGTEDDIDIWIALARKAAN